MKKDKKIDATSPEHLTQIAEKSGFELAYPDYKPMDWEKIFKVQRPYRTKQSFTPLKDITPEVNTKASMTIPNETLTIPEMLKRQAHGIPITGSKIAMYQGEEFMPDPKTMDISELHKIIHDNNAKIAEINADIQERKDKAELMRLQKQWEAAELVKKDKLSQFQQLKAELYPDNPA